VLLVAAVRGIAEDYESDELPALANAAGLLDAAADVFARKGFAAATLDEIAEAAGFTRGAVHHHFSSKEEMFLAVIARRDEELLASYEPLAADSLPPDPRTNAEQWRDVHATDRLDTLLRLELRLLALRDDSLRRRLVDVDRRATTATAERLSEVAAAHDMSWRHPPDQIATLLHLVSGTLRVRAALGETDSVALMETFLRLVWDSSIQPSPRRATPSPRQRRHNA
jgi:AcrR family transcriptional regulator